MAAAKSVLLAFLLSSFLAGTALGKGYSTTRLSEGQQCRLRRIQSVQPNQRIESEGGLTELWDYNDEQFECAGVVACRNTLRQNSLFLPEFHNAPRLIYIERGRGLLGITFPGCAETYHSDPSAGERRGGLERLGGQSETEQSERRDQHQKVHRIRRGDIIAIPEGAVHWCYNDGDEELVAISVIDLNNQNNQLDERPRAFFLAGGFGGGERGFRGQTEGRGGRFNYRNIFQGFDEHMLAESYGVSPDLIRRMQSQNTDRGIMIQVRERMRVVAPEQDDEEFELEEEERFRRRRFNSEEDEAAARNGFEETFCTMKVRQNIEVRREAEVHSRQAGKLNLVNMHKMPILQYIDMSAERGRLNPRALYTPHWSITDHRLVYVLRGNAHVQITDNNGENIFDERVNEGEMFVIPQFYTTVARASNEGFEWVSFKTSGQPMKSPLAGYTSVLRALPIEVIENAYEMSPREAMEVKFNRDHQTFLLSPSQQGGGVGRFD
ncbi:hypothetical protein MLD38_031864 [Melastoma candidum]|uniref:Uncharacterized protein n=2 Tax=Melastoma candidum TaxID=119954 RepID=A0ACB9MS51_9MYRT|nr:hypothetical protein MLD38_031864 [Melastoma candidum]